ncbi:MAG: tetratricopeptide repeat protein [Cyclobacteriaceae bacterium]|nr:tetratricopeptide repeat protein [Cyclobacteriaceae bacterium]
MATENESDSRAKKFRRLALGTSFLLAFTWPLGSFFVWIFLGATVYFIFLAYYYGPRPAHEKVYESNSQSWTQENKSFEQKKAPNAKLAIMIVVIVAFSILFILMIIGFVTGVNTPEQSSDFLQENLDRETLQTNPSDLNALTNVGNELYAQNQFDSALIYYNKVLAIDPQNSSGLYNKALVYYQKQEYIKSIELSKKCAALYPENTGAMALTGDSYYAQERPSEAMTWYRQAYDNGARGAELLNMIAYLYEQQNRKSEAIQFYKETLQQDSSFVNAYERLAELEPARAAWYKNKAAQYK